MIKFNSNYYREGDAPKFYINLDWYGFEDFWHGVYGRDGYQFLDKKEVERKKKLNANRYKWRTFKLDINGLSLSIDVRLNKVGNIYHGRLRDPEKEARKRRKMRARRSVLDD